MKVQGLITKINYDGRLKGNQFMIFTVQDIDSIGKRPVYHKVVGNYDPLIAEGNGIEAEGVSEESKFGVQVRYDTLSDFILDKEQMVIDNLSRALTLALTSIDRIGVAYAERLIVSHDLMNAAMPIDALLKGVQADPHLPPSILNAIEEGLDLRGPQVRFAVNFLSQSSHLTINQSDKAFEYFKGNVNIPLRNPYRMVEIDGISFGTANLIAKDIGIEPGSPEQIIAACYFAINEEGGIGGHTVVDKGSMHARLATLIGDKDRKAVEEIMAYSALFTFIEGDKVQLTKHAIDERNIASSVEGILNAESCIANSVQEVSTGIKDGTLKVCPSEDITYTDEQMGAITSAIENNFSLILGGAGCGKTTVAEGVIEAFMLAGIKKEEILCVASTGKAAKRMKESVKMPTSTIHLALGYNGTTFAKGKNNPFDKKVILVDEPSMIDSFLGSKLLEAVKEGSHVVFTGDYNQLPSVGPGLFLKNLMDSGKVPVNYLTLNKRTKVGGITLKSMQLNVGDKEGFFEGIAEHDDLKYIKVNEAIARGYSEANADKPPMSAPEIVNDLVVKNYLMMQRKGYDIYDEVQVLTPMRKGISGLFELNRRLRDVLNPNAKEYAQNLESRRNIPAIDAREYQFFEGDKIMQIVNDYDNFIMNGEIGVLKSIDTKQRAAICDFEGREVEISFADFLKSVEPAWAMTGHKSQGSEYKGVIIPLSKEHTNMMTTELVYTMMTRARESLFLIGDDSNLHTAFKNKTSKQRNTNLLSALDKIDVSPRYSHENIEDMDNMEMDYAMDSKM